MIRPTALLAAIAISLLAVSGAGGTSAQTPKRGGTLVFRQIGPEPPCLNILSELCDPPPTPIVDAILAKPFEVAPDFTYRSSLTTGHIHEEAPRSR
jgi:hypothetical protein